MNHPPLWQELLVVFLACLIGPQGNRRTGMPNQTTKRPRTSLQIVTKAQVNGSRRIRLERVRRHKWVVR